MIDQSKIVKGQHVSVISTPFFKLKDKVGRSYQAIDLEKQFGFLPKMIIVEKAEQGNNVLVVRAVVPEELIAKEYKEQKSKISAMKP